MHRIPKIFTHSSDRRTNSSSSRQAAKIKPRLDRRNASNDINYDYSASTSSSSSLSSSSSSYYYSSEESQRTRSLDLYGGGKTSFRIDGVDGEIEILCKTLGFSGIDDFGISPEEYEVMKVRSCSAPVVLVDDAIEPLIDRGSEVNCDNAVDVVSNQSEETCGLGVYSDNVDGVRRNVFCSGLEYGDVSLRGDISGTSNVFRGKGINGVRPPVLEHPSLVTLPAVDKECSNWDSLRAFSPENDASVLRFEGGLYLDEIEEGTEDSCTRRKEDEEGRMDRREGNIMLTESYSFTTSNDDDSSSTTTEPMSSISPNGRGRRIIVGWQKGELLGRGSFGSVYEGIADDGTFFAVKEVSLLAQGDDGRQSIIQLEQEIALLSQFKHENIVQYFGTKKDESHLYIFLELVTKGSLLSLYQKYCLKDPQVSAYTRQILRGLKYLHDRDVVHRDIKCANILVDTNGLVKLADFGLARATKLNDVKSCKGTVFWMAPEVVRSLGYGLPADIWSLGCTVLEMLTRRFPYSNFESMQALFRIGRGERPTIPDTLSSDARDFILKCLQVDPSLRPTAAQLLDHPFVKQPLPSSSGMGSPYNFRRQM